MVMNNVAPSSRLSGRPRRRRVQREEADASSRRTDCRPRPVGRQPQRLHRFEVALPEAHQLIEHLALKSPALPGGIVGVLDGEFR